MAIPKQEPLAKTILTELTIDIADLNRRKREMQVAQAIRVLPPDSITKGDETITSAHSLVKTLIKNVAFVNSWESFTVKLEVGADSVTIPCKGVFLIYGTFDKITVSSSVDVRVSYVFS